MTIKELKEKIKKLPDDTIVHIDDGYEYMEILGIDEDGNLLTKD